MEEKFTGKYRINSCSLQGYDCGSNGAYFITICTKNREHFFCDVIHVKMRLSEIRKMANRRWLAIPEHFPFFVLDEWVLMPNHVGVIFINKCSVVETQDLASLRLKPKNFTYKNKFGPQSRNVVSIIRGFKIGVTKYARNNGILFEWQSRFHDRIIRDHGECGCIYEYIKNNPGDWEGDRNNLQ